MVDEFLTECATDVDLLSHRIGLARYDILMDRDIGVMQLFELYLFKDFI
jgi:hypothetical protein